MPPSPTRIPSPSDFSSLGSTVPVKLHFPHPLGPESVTAILILLHGLGDSDLNFSGFAKSLNLPNVLAITVRGVNPVPPSFLEDPSSFPSTISSSSSPNESSSSTTEAAVCQNFHWGDDLRLDTRTGELDADPGFTRAEGVIARELVGRVLVEKCGWTTADIILLGYGQGGSLALGVARRSPTEYRGVVSIAGGLPRSMVPSESGRPKSKTPVLVLCGRESESVDEDAEELLEEEFDKVKVVRWAGRREDGMPRSREEVLPMMEFLAQRLRSGGVAGWMG